MKKRVVAYCRVSTDKEDQANSLKNQKQYFETLINNNNEWEFSGLFADEGISGTATKKRDEFNRMIAMSKTNSFDIIVTKSVSRFARNVEDCIHYVKDLKSRNIEIRFITDNINTFDNDSDLRLGIMSTLAQDESRQTSERVLLGQKVSMKNGVVFGRNMLGYNIENGKMYINKEEAPIIERIFNKYLIEGKGTHIIAKELQEEGIKTKNGGNKWNNASIYKILKNEKYCGDLIQQKTYTTDYLTHQKKYNKGEKEFIKIENHHEAIISKEMFLQTQEEIKRRKEMCNADGSKHSNRYALSGKIKCGCCGSTYVGGDNRKRKDGTTRKSWKCYEKHKYGKKHINSQGDYIGCNNSNVNNEIVLTICNKLLKKISQKDKDEIIKNTLKVISSTLKNSCSLDDVEQKLTQKKEKLETQKRKAIRLCIEGLITESELKQQKADIENELHLVNQNLTVIKEKQSLSKNKDKLLQEITTFLNKFFEFNTISNEEIFKQVIEKVVVKSKTEFDIYIRGYTAPFFSLYKSNILSTMFLYHLK